jgi:hypothetical protein
MLKKNMGNPFVDLVYDAPNGNPSLYDLVKFTNDKPGSPVGVCVLTAVIAVVVLAQYVMKHLVPVDGGGWTNERDSPRVIESEPSSTKNWYRTVRRCTDAFTIVAVLLLLFGTYGGEKIGAGWQKAGLCFACTILFVVSSMLSRFVGKVGPHGCGDKVSTCTGLQDWPFWLLVSFLLVYGLSMGGPKIMLAAITLMAVVGAFVSIPNLSAKDDQTDGDTGRTMLDIDFGVQLVFAVMMMVVYWRCCTSFLQKDSSATTGAGSQFGIDASSVY